MGLREAVDQSITALLYEEMDAAAIELARVYAGLLDQAGVIRAQADKALRQAEQTGDETLIEQVAALRAKLGERECIDRIGARLHSLLHELHATPKSRGGARATSPKTSTLARLRSVQ